MDDQMGIAFPDGIRCDLESLYPSGHARGVLTFPDFFLYCKCNLKYLLNEYPDNPDKYVRSFKTSVNGKIRQIVTYQSSGDGQKLRQLHRMFALALSGIYEPHPKSYAYQQGKSSVLCLKRHLYSDTFLKSDIHSYFDTISYELLFKKLSALASWGKRQIKLLEKTLAACFCDGHLPVGFVSSPILSDLYLYDLDRRMSGLKGIHYTRYADDFIISASGPQADARMEEAMERLKDEISKHRLELNGKKTFIRQLKMEGDAIHLLGLNVVKTDKSRNRITVSGRYITETGKELGDLLVHRSDMDPWEMRRRFASVMGKVSFISYASKDSAEKLRKLIRVKTGIEIDLSYKALSSALMEDPAILQDYEIQKQLDAYVRIKGVSFQPESGRAWERVAIPANDEYARSALRRHLFAVCREFEPGGAGRLTVNRLELNVGDEHFVFAAPPDTSRFRELIGKIRTDKTAVSYSSDYCYDNGKTDTLVKYGGEYMKPGAFRPLSGIYRIGSCFLYLKDQNAWRFNQDTDRQVPPRKSAFEKADLAEFAEKPDWQGYLDIDLHWPLKVEEGISARIAVLTDTIEKQLRPWLEKDEAIPMQRCITQKLNITASSQTLMDILDSFHELTSLVKQAEGISNFNAWFIPADFLEATDETMLKFIQVSTKNGRFELMKFAG